MVRRWSRLIVFKQPLFSSLSDVLTGSQSVNLHVIYDFSKTTVFTSSPLRRKLMRRKYYSGIILQVSVLHFWSKEYRFYKLCTSQLTNSFLFKTNFSCYNFIKTVLFQPPHCKISEESRLITCISKVVNWSQTKNNFSPFYDKTLLSIYTEAKWTKSNFLIASTKALYTSWQQPWVKARTTFQLLTSLPFWLLAQQVKLRYKLFILLTMNSTLKLKPVYLKN